MSVTISNTLYSIVEKWSLHLKNTKNQLSLRFVKVIPTKSAKNYQFSQTDHSERFSLVQSTPCYSVVVAPVRAFFTL